MTAKNQKPCDTQWYVLACETGGYYGTIWEGNSSGGIVRPRKAVVESLKPPMYHVVGLYSSLDDATIEARRAGQIFPQGFKPVKVRIEGSGPKNSRIVLL